MDHKDWILPYKPKPAFLIHRLTYCLILMAVLYCSLPAWSATISGKVINQNGKPLQGVTVIILKTQQSTITAANGTYRLEDVKPGNYRLTAFVIGLKDQTKEVNVKAKGNNVNFNLKPLEEKLKEIEVRPDKGTEFGIKRLSGVEGVAIYESKKSEVVIVNQLLANLATNNSRQVYAKVAGLNIWENDGAGIQLGIGGRGLNPSRVSNFNTRQNGYDISADALGYPESYYSPPTEGLERIEIVRGAASLQYGTQFGGLINFRMKKGPKDKRAEIITRQTVGSFGLFSSFNSIGGSTGKLNYYTFYQYKTGNGWRQNSNFNAHTAHTNLHYQLSEKLSLHFDYTFMNYVAQQPGGLTDALFEQDPRQSLRDRNWFRVNWNLASITLDYQISSLTQLEFRNFGLLAGRDALGFLGVITRIDPLTERDLLSDRYSNFGNETRLIHRYSLGDQVSAFLIGNALLPGPHRPQAGLFQPWQRPGF